MLRESFLARAGPALDRGGHLKSRDHHPTRDRAAERGWRGATLLALAVLWASFGWAATPASAAVEEAPRVSSWTGNVNLFLGAKFLDDEEWEPVDTQAEGGLLIDFRHRVLPFNLAIDFLYSRDEDDVDVEMLGLGKVRAEVVGQTWEVDLGLRKIWEQPRVLRPFLGGGVALVHAEIEASARGESVSDRDTVLGVWLDTGLYLTLSRRWNVGIEGRWSWAKADLLEVDDGDIGGWHLGALAGVHW